MASTLDTDNDFAFFELLGLPEEFCYVPLSELPFKELTKEDLWMEYGICTKQYCDPSGSSSLIRGNYLAAQYLRKIRQNAKQGGKGISQQRSPLGRLLEFPVELILEIFGHLHPVDLFTLIRTTKTLRSLLLSRGSADVWAHAFTNYKDVPPVPKGMSPPKWTTMLYGPPHCDSCKVYPAMVDFTYHDRFCKNCMIEQVYTSEQTFHIIQPHSGGQGVVYVRGTYKFYSMLYPAGHTELSFWNAHYRICDVKEYRFQLTSYENDIRRGVPEAQNALNKFLQERSQTVEDDHKIMMRHSAWAEDALYSSVIANHDITFRIIQNWKKRLIALGHHPADLDIGHEAFVCLFREYYIFTVKQGKKGFNRCKRDLEHAIQAKIYARKGAERKSRVNEVLEFYDAIVLHNMPPSLWKSLPPKDNILSLDPIRQYVDTGHPTTSHCKNITGIVQLLDGFVHRWLRFSETPVFWGLVAAGYDVCENDVRLTINIASMSVFICPNHPWEAPIGWEHISAHIRCILDATATWNDNCPELSFSALGHGIVNSLIISIGKNPSTTTVSELDEANPVFLCSDCTLRWEHRPMLVYGSFFFTWRQAVLHGVVYKPGHGNFVKVVEETRQYIVGRQKPFPDPLDLGWACNYCSEHLCQPMKRIRVATHLAKWHDIRNPKWGTDAIYVGSWKPPKPIFLAREPSECHICLLCPLARHPKIYYAYAVKMHLATKHHITNPAEGTHWKHLEIPQIAPVPD